MNTSDFENDNNNLATEVPVEAVAFPSAVDEPSNEETGLLDQEEIEELNEQGNSEDSQPPVEEQPLVRNLPVFQEKGSEFILQNVIGEEVYFLGKEIGRAVIEGMHVEINSTGMTMFYKLKNKRNKVKVSDITFNLEQAQKALWDRKVTPIKK